MGPEIRTPGRNSGWCLFVYLLVPIVVGMALQIYGDDLKGLRDAHYLTLRAVADLTGSHHTYLCRLETAEATSVRPATVLKLAEALECPPGAITGDKKAHAAALKAAQRDPRALRAAPVAA